MIPTGRKEVPEVQTLVEFLTNVGSVLSVAQFALIAWMGFYLYRYKMVEVKDRVGSNYKELAESQEKITGNLKERLKTLEGSQKMQENRILRLEIENEKKELLYIHAQKEIEILERMLYMILPLVDRLGRDMKIKMEHITRELNEVRVANARAIMEWEQKKDSILIYMNSSNSNSG